MEKTSVQKLAGVLKVLVTVTFVCNLLVLPLVPGLATSNGKLLVENFDAVAWWEIAWVSWSLVFQIQYYTVLTVFLWFCGICTAVILWQARKVLDNILAGQPFRKLNAKCLTTAAVCCFLISAAALVRVVWRIWYYRSLVSLCSYNALFVPLFFMGGLLCMVMSALFRQAFELKSENDLTI